MLIECSTLLLTSVWGVGMPAVVCTLRTCCPRRLSVGVTACSNRSGYAFICNCVASTMHCRSVVAWKFLSLPVMTWMALTPSANACITLSVCVIEGLVMHLCWNRTVLDRCLLLVFNVAIMCVIVFG